ncbi:hypothetical protein CIRG_05503 [Coccidioides immitis RMSCC 2394]|uniref:Uncharacterized protein n=1 Tax=Coccidioides immitis RMSCC 2394 TaxID=404692 RepID=A0A0J7B7A7_COCIT|nr:hypothetical protein CIRG_05503 [Coccidioides immitis RMSCC 2394]
MIISSRRDPYGMAVRRTHTAGSLRLAPLVLRVPFINSPLPSPSLPSTFPPRAPRSSDLRVLKPWWRLSLILGCCLTVTWLTFSIWHIEGAVVACQSHGENARESFGNNTLPDTPGPIMIKDERGRTRWTVSIPPDHIVPLSPSTYARICMETWDLAAHVSLITNTKSRTIDGQLYRFHYQDKNFIDIVDAQELGLLPSNYPTQFPAKTMAGLGRQEHSTEDLPPCKKSLTFVLELDDAGFGVALMGLWMAYGLAKEEGRAFFIDDSNWAYGKYTTYFKAPPLPTCHPPFMSQRIPCPLQARHLLVSPSTFRWIFNKNFSERFESRHKTGVDRQKPIFSLLRTGYENLFLLSDTDNAFYRKRIMQLRTDRQGVQVGIHIRRGDCHPLEFQYENSYIPLDVYTQRAEELVKSLTAQSLSQAAKNTTIVASDDPDVYLAPEMRHVRKAQSYISLISKSTLGTASATPRQPVDTNSGWEGGFFNGLFWSLGSPFSRPRRSDSPPPSKYPTSLSSSSGTTHPLSGQSADTSTFTSDDDQLHLQSLDNALRLREFVGRAYILDLAVLGSSDAIVCGVSSVTCRLLGVILGWERAIGQKRWKNVDGPLHWQSFIW